MYDKQNFNRYTVGYNGAAHVTNTSIPLSHFFSHTMLRLIRALSTYTKAEIEGARKWLLSFDHAKVPRSIFEISFSRSSGPGGQKVNKTSSKATVSLEPHQWLQPQFCYWIPKPILSQIATKKLRYQTKAGGLLIQSDSSRNRETNTDECFRKLVQAIKETAHFEAEVSEEDKRKWAEIAEEQKEKRLYHKKKQSDKKKLRQKKFDV